MAPSSVGVAMPSVNWVMVPRHPVPRRRRRFHLDGPPSPLKQACTSPVLCLTTDLFRVGVKITKGNWAEATRTPQAISLKEHQDSRFQCRVVVQLSQWTSAITWSVVCWTTAALLAGPNTEVGKHRHSGTTSVAQILPRMLPQVVILLVV